MSLLQLGANGTITFSTLAESNFSKLNSSNISVNNQITATNGRFTSTFTAFDDIGDTFTSGESRISRFNNVLNIYGDKATGVADIAITPAIRRVNMSNVSVHNLSANVITGNIAGNLQAGTGIALSISPSGITTITNTGGSVTDPLNISKLNASNISVNGDITTTNMNALGTIGAAVIASADFIGGTGSFTTMRATTGNFSKVNSSNISVNSGITCNDLDAVGNLTSNTLVANNVIANSNFGAAVGSIVDFTTTDITINDKTTIGQSEIERANDILNIYGDKTSSPDIVVDPLLKIINMSNISVHNISANIIAGDISSNLAASLNIGLSTALGITTISTNSTVNFSQVNSSNILCNDTVNTVDLVAGSVFATSIQGDISTNLAAGTGISLATVGGVTTITNTGGSVTDPLNISKINVSNISVDGDLSATNISASGEIYSATSITANAFDAQTIIGVNGYYTVLESTTISGVTGNFSTGNFSTGNFSILNTNVSQVNTTTVNTSTLNASTINGDISSNLSAGLNTSLTTTSGVTQITSILSSWISLILASNYAPGNGTGYNIRYDTILSGNLSYTQNNGTVTIPTTGLYAISGSLVFDVASGTSRVNTRIRMRVNNNFVGGYAQAYGYSRFATEVSLSTATFPEWIGNLTAGDLITMRAEIAVGTNNQFDSSWTGYQIVNGSALTIKRIS